MEVVVLFETHCCAFFFLNCIWVWFAGEMKLVGETIFDALKGTTKGDAKIEVYTGGVVAGDIGRHDDSWGDGG